MPSKKKESDHSEGAHKNHLLQVRLPRDLWLKFRYACLREDCTPSEMLRTFIRSYVKREKAASDLLRIAERDIKERIYGLTVEQLTDEVADYFDQRSKEKWPRPSDQPDNEARHDNRIIDPEDEAGNTGGMDDAHEHRDQRTRNGVGESTG